MTPDEIRYTLAKQIPTMREIVTDYGMIDLDSELLEAVADALRSILTKRLDALKAGGVQP